jgi:hypothetical protein
MGILMGFGRSRLDDDSVVFEEPVLVRVWAWDFDKSRLIEAALSCAGAGVA